MQRFSGSRLREIRKAKGLVRERLAVDIGRSLASIDNYELGHVEPPPTILCLIADRLGVDVAEFFVEVGDAVVA